jgi:hypothetical protein
VVAAHNLLRWTHLIALPGQTIRTARTRAPDPPARRR